MTTTLVTIMMIVMMMMVVDDVDGDDDGDGDEDDDDDDDNDNDDYSDDGITRMRMILLSLLRIMMFLFPVGLSTFLAQRGAGSTSTPARRHTTSRYSTRPDGARSSPTL